MLSYLLLMRHAKSSWPDAIQSDHERPLTPRGEQTAEAIGKILTARHYAPDTIWSSDATRTRQTAMHLIRAIPGAQTVLFNSQLYHASAEQMHGILAREPEPSGGLMLLGHNPGLSALHEYFTGQSHDYPPAACTVLARQEEQSGHWTSPACWRYVDLLIPKDLGL